MAQEKLFTAKQATVAVLEKVGEILKKSAIAKLDGMQKSEGYKPQNSKKENAKPSEHNSKDADQHAEGKGPKGEIHPKEHEAAPSDSVQPQKDPQHNSKEEAEGNNELAGTTPTQVGQDGKNMPGGDEIKGHLKLAKFVGRMDYKRRNKENQAKVVSQQHVGNAQAESSAQHQQSLGKSEKRK